MPSMRWRDWRPALFGARQFRWCRYLSPILHRVRLAGGPGVRVETIGNATLYLGDCLSVMPTLSPNVVITDQPFGTGWFRGGGKRAGEFKRRKEGAEWDVFDLRWMDQVSCPLVAFCPTKGVWEMCLRLKTPCVVKYRKSNPAPFGVECEPIVCSQPPRSVWEKTGYNGANELHPCQKPEAIMDWLVGEFSDAGQTVLDPFMGSGSTGYSAVRMGRTFIGVEIDPSYFDIACERIERAQRQERLFA